MRKLFTFISLLAAAPLFAQTVTTQRFLHILQKTATLPQNRLESPM